MKSIASTLLGVCLLMASSYAQNPVDWSRQYDCQQHDDCFNDIFATVDRGYITCGQSDQSVWLTKMDGNGEIQWSRTYGGGGNVYDAVWTIIEVDGGGYLVGMMRNENFCALRVDSAGEIIWWRDYDYGICHALIELKDSRFILVGHGYGNIERAGRLLMVDSHGEVIWDKYYDPGYCDLYALKETNGGIIITGSIAPNVDENIEDLQTCLVKFDYNGEVIWEKIITLRESSIGRGVVAARDGGYALTGYCSWSVDVHNGGQMYLVKTDHEGELSWWRAIPMESEVASEFGWSILAPQAGGYAIVGMTDQLWANGNSYLKMVYTTDMGVITWKRLFGAGFFYSGESKRQMFYSVIKGHDNSILAAGNILNHEERGLNGFIIKLVPRLLEPMRLEYEPRDTSLFVFPGTDQRFTVHVIGVITGVLNVVWSLDGADVGNDTTVVINFGEELGAHEVGCFVADEVSSGSVTWHVIVDDLFIVRSSPEEEVLLIPRGRSKMFSIDSVASRFLPDQLNYYWTQSRADGEVLNEWQGTDSVDIEFNRVGEYLIKGVVGHEDQSDEVEWRVEVAGLIWAYVPDAHLVNMRPNAAIDFQLIPLISDPANVYSWYLNGELKAGGDDSTFVARFEEAGQFHLVGILTDGQAVDSVGWDIRVSNDVSVEDYPVVMPSNPGLLTALPNPFNSTVRILFATINRGKQTLTIHDIRGREVANFNGKLKMEHGTGEVVWNASSLPAGIYFARMASGSDIHTVKMVLIR